MSLPHPSLITPSGWDMDLEKVWLESAASNPSSLYNPSTNNQYPAMRYYCNSSCTSVPHEIYSQVDNIESPSRMSVIPADMFSTPPPCTNSEIFTPPKTITPPLREHSSVYSFNFKPMMYRKGSPESGNSESEESVSASSEIDFILSNIPLEDGSDTPIVNSGSETFNTLSFSMDDDSDTSRVSSSPSELCKKRIRSTRKEDISELKKKCEQLQGKLVKLKITKKEDMKLHPEQYYWKHVALSLKGKLGKSMDRNSALREAVEGQMKLNRTLEMYLKRQSKLKKSLDKLTENPGQIHLDSNPASRKRAMHAMTNTLMDSYMEMFVSTDLLDRKENVFNQRVETKNGKVDLYEMACCQVFPQIPLDEWHFVVENCHLLLRTQFIDKPTIKRRVLDRLDQNTFYVEYRFSQESMDYVNRIVLKKHVRGQKVVVVFKSVLYDEKYPNGTDFIGDETGWCLMELLPSNLSPNHGTLSLKTVFRTRPPLRPAIGCLQFPHSDFNSRSFQQFFEGVLREVDFETDIKRKAPYRSDTACPITNYILTLFLNGTN